MSEASVPLETLAQEIVARYKKGNDMLISAGKQLLEAKRRVEGGEAGEEWTWPRWRAVHLLPHITKGWINIQLKIADSRDPEKAASDHRERANEALRRHRDKLSSGNFEIAACDDVDDHQCEEIVASYFDLPRRQQDEFLRRIGAIRMIEK